MSGKVASTHRNIQDNKVSTESRQLEDKKNELTESEKRRKEDIILIQELLGQGYQPVYIRELTGHTYRTIRKYKTGDPDILCRNSITGRKRDSKLDAYANTIIQKLSEGMILKDIFSFISNQGYKGKLTNFYSYSKRIIEENDLEYHTSKNTLGAPINRTKLRVRYANRKEILDFLWLGKEIAAKDKEIIFKTYPILYEIQACIKEFREIFNKKNIAYLYLYIEKCQNSQIRNLKSFVNGLLRDIDAVENAVSSPLSNGFVEGGNSRLKMIKRMMYGKAGLPLLKAKILC